MHETSGKMKDIIMKFINDEKLTDDELNTMRWYIHQFADAMPNKPKELHRIFEMNQEELRIYNRLLFERFGIDTL